MNIKNINTMKMNKNQYRLNLLSNKLDSLSN